MKSQEIVNTLGTLKQKSLSVNSRAQVITMANGGQLATGGGPYPVRTLPVYLNDQHRIFFHQGVLDWRRYMRMYCSIMLWLCLGNADELHIASHRWSPRNHVYDNESHGQYPSWRGAYRNWCRSHCGSLQRRQYYRSPIYINIPVYISQCARNIN